MCWAHNHVQMEWKSGREVPRRKVLQHSKQVKQQIEQCTCKGQIWAQKLIKRNAKMKCNQHEKSWQIIAKKRYRKNMIKLTKIVLHIQPMCHSIYEQNPTKEQLGQEETVRSQTLMLSLQPLNLSLSQEKLWTNVSKRKLYGKHNLKEELHALKRNRFPEKRTSLKAKLKLVPFLFL